MAGLRGGRTLVNHLHHLLADFLQIDSKALEHPGGNALALADEAEQQVLRADVAVIEPARFVNSELDDLLCARGQANFANDRAFATTDGRLLWDFDTVRSYETVNGVPATGGSLDGPGPVVVAGRVFVSSGYPRFGGTPGNVLLAFGVAGDGR